MSENLSTSTICECVFVLRKVNPSKRMFSINDFEVLILSMFLFLSFRVYILFLRRLQFILLLLVHAVFIRITNNYGLIYVTHGDLIRLPRRVHEHFFLY